MAKRRTAPHTTPAASAARTPPLWITIIAGWLLIVMGMLFAVMGYAPLIPMIFIVAGTVLVLVHALRHNPYGADSVADERTRKLGAQAVAQSWLITLLAAMLLFWTDYLKVVPLTAGQAIGILLFVMIITATVLQWAYKRRPDVV